ncbi:MAG: phosphotransferase family protein [Steroidobacteraceae bacterium]|nr:phosphotransferase family protein [Steroidobacteraceae bacterium]
MSPIDTDASRPVRAGEELDVAKLEAWLGTVLPDATGPLRVRQFPSGFSNLTYALELGGREFVLRRPPFGARIKSAHDMGREFRVLSALHPVYGKVPRPLAYCTDEAVLGAPFYVMERVQGVVPRADTLARLAPDAATMRRMGFALVDALAELHAFDYRAAGLADFGRPEGYVRRQVEGWSERYVRAATDEIPEMDAAARWLAANLPAESGAALIHNDFKYDNLVVDPADPARIVAVLDWEMATLGDPAMEVGGSLAYLLEPGDPPELQALVPWRAGMITRAEFLERYEQVSGRALRDAAFYRCYGHFRLGVVAQQIYRRWRDGHSKDPRFGALLAVARACARQAVSVT